MRLLISSVLFFLVAIGVTLAYGEKYNDSTEFDIPDDAQFMEKSCEFKSIGEHLRYTCEWRFNFEQAQEWIEQQDEKFQEEINEIIEEQEKEKTPEPVKELTPTEKLIQRLNEQLEADAISSADRELLRLLEKLNKCDRGLGNSDPIQKDGSWIIPDTDPRTYGKAYDYRSNAKFAELVMAFEECRGQKTLESDKVTGPQYGNIAKANENDTQKYHAEIAEHLTPIPYPKFHPEMMAKGEQRALMTICLSDVYPQGYKIQQGCQISFDDEIKQFSEPRELTDIQKEAHKRAGAICDMNMPNAYKMDMGCQIETDNSRTSDTKQTPSILENPVFNEWFFYKQDPVENDYKQLQKVRQQALEKYLKERNP